MTYGLYKCSLFFGCEFIMACTNREWLENHKKRLKEAGRLKLGQWYVIEEY